MNQSALLLAFAAVFLLFAGCVSEPATGSNASNALNNTLNEDALCQINNASCQILNSSANATGSILPPLKLLSKVEIIHFHSTNQCYSCITVGKYAEETVNTYFAEEVKSGRITFAHRNIDLPENQEMVSKYGTTGSSLWIGVYDKGVLHKEQNNDVWYKIGNKEEYMAYLKGIIDKRLEGDYS